MSCPPSSYPGPPESNGCAWIILITAALWLVMALIAWSFYHA